MRLQVQRPRARRAAGLARQRPALEAPPEVGAGLEYERRGSVCRRRGILQMLVEKRLHHLAAELPRGVASEFQRSERGAVVVDTAVAPGTERQEYAVMPAALRAGGFDPVVPTTWLLEGLLIYLAPADARALLATVTSLSPPGSEIALENAGRRDPDLAAAISLANVKIERAPFPRGAVSARVSRGSRIPAASSSPIAR